MEKQLLHFIDENPRFRDINVPPTLKIYYVHLPTNTQLGGRDTKMGSKKILEELQFSEGDRNPPSFKAHHF